MNTIIPTNKLFSGVALAPMAGVTDLAFRTLCNEFGAAYTVTEMVSSKAIAFNNKKTLDLMQLESSKNHIQGIQLFGSEPKVMAEAAKVALEFSPDFIDINMGCPALKILKSGSGCALMQDPELCGKIVNAVTKTVNVPVSVKIRKGFDSKNLNALQIAQICEANGASAVTVHGRTGLQYYNGTADLDIIKIIKANLKIPVIGNGDILTVLDAQNMLKHTNCDGIMIGRGTLGNPWIFKLINDPKFSVAFTEKIHTMIKHVESICNHKGEKIGIKESRKHIVWYLKGFKCASQLRNLACTLTNLEELYSLANTALHYFYTED